MNRTWHIRIRKTHRYLGVFIGVQFLLWTVGGLYFSWSNLDDINGNHLKRPAVGILASISLVSPSVPLQALQYRGVDSVLSVALIDVQNLPVYQVSYRMQDGNGHAMTHTQLANARTAQLRGELTQAEATALAQQRFVGGSAFGPSAVERMEYLTSTNGHHEYREKPWPAYAITLRQPAHAAVAVAAQLGTVQSLRTDPWRIFDLLWMLHTKDYEGRHDINNGLLRVFSILGLLTITSGFALYLVSSPQLRQKKANRHKQITLQS